MDQLIGDDQILWFGADKDYGLTYDTTKGRLVLVDSDDGDLLESADGEPTLSLLGSLIGPTKTVSDTNTDTYLPPRGEGVVVVFCSAEAGLVKFDVNDGVATKIADANGKLEAIDDGGSATDGNLGIEASSSGVLTNIVIQNETGSEQDVILIPLG